MSLWTTFLDLLPEVLSIRPDTAISKALVTV